MADGVLSRDRRALTVGLLVAIAAFAVEGMGVVPALPTAVKALGALNLFGWAFSSFMLAWLVGTVAGGLVADARGPRLPMALGLLGFSGGLLLAGLAPRIFVFLMGRAIQGAGGGALIAAAYVAIARGYPDALRPRMMALTASVWILPAIAGPALSGAVVEWFGWRVVFVGVVPVIAVTALVVLPPLRAFDLPVPVAQPDSIARLRAAIRVAVGAALALSVLDLLRGGTRFGIALAILAATSGAVLAGPALAQLLPRGTWLARPGLPAALAARALLAFSFFATEAFVPLGAGQLRGAKPAEAGVALSAGAFGWIAASWFQDRVEASGGEGGRAARVALGFGLVACGIASVGTTLVTALPLFLVPIGWAVAGAGIGLAYSAGGLICIAAAPHGKEGEVSGQLQLTEAFSTAAGTGIGGALFALFAHAGRPPAQAHVVVFALTFVAAVLGLVVASRRLA